MRLDTGYFKFSNALKYFINSSNQKKFYNSTIYQRSITGKS
ncbi:hypothetical protein QW060_13100 [Myroides ceti]|uniref:Ribosomal protein L32 n=1 Tax=Paenimyroides ceti TaxID=395087 RepID=A0ABT8CUW0_9FLAO|nr:hypothetical protein [Paenimyroides ceti]MDN3708045.1 hypothetical protein [Paenimyroides ceti]